MAEKPRVELARLKEQRERVTDSGLLARIEARIAELEKNLSKRLKNDDPG
jgi:hypothetical protein